jgi:HAMP domain-containing protein
MLQKLNEVFKNIKLGQQISILLSLVFLVGLLLSGVALHLILYNHAQHQIAGEAAVLLKTMKAIRDYTNTQFTPELEERSVAEFLPQTIPSYTAREIFEMLRKDPTWQNYFYKEATLNPTNIRDKADSFEVEIINRFRQDSNLQELSGFQSTPNGELFYIATPIKIEQPSCLECHSTPDRAPKSMLARYGSENGFGWQLNEIVGAKTIYVPGNIVFQKARQSFVVVMGTVIGILAVAIWLVNGWLKRSVVRPLSQITQVAEALSTGDLEAEFETQYNDEIGTLARAFTRMKTSLVLAMKRLERYRQ